MFLSSVVPRFSLPGRTALLASAILLAGSTAAAERPRGSYQVIPAELAAPPADVAPPEVLFAPSFIIYMNRDGGTYTPGFNDSRTNRSSIPRETSTIAPWSVSEAGWQQVMSCVRDQFARFNVEITDVDPGSVPHIESVVGGRPGDLGLDPNVGGVSPFTSDCSVIQNSIVFTFAELYGTRYRDICEVVAQEVAHSFGLDHQYLCQDPMTYLGGCGPKSFQDVSAQCGENQPRTCLCGQPSQNSVQLLNQRLGPRLDGELAPVVSILHPADGSVVGQGFGIYIDARSPVAVERVDVYLDGIHVGAATATAGADQPYVVVAPRDLEPGTYVLEAIATNDVDQTSTSIAVTVSSQGGGAGDGSGSSGSGGVSGGCTAAGGAGGGLLALLASLVPLAATRRRRPAR